MSSKRTAAVVVLGILLTVTLSVGNVVYAAHATALDPDFATNAIEDENGYEALGDLFEDPLTSQVSGGDDGAGEGGFAELVDESAYEGVVDAEYMQSEFEPNIYRVYAYLHGNEDRLNLSLDTEPIAENVGNATAGEVENSSAAELYGAMGSGDLGDVSIDRSTVEKLDGGPQSYEAAQAEVRASVYDRLLTGAVDQAYQEQSNDDLLSLVIEDYDPDEYSETEKEQLVDEREAEIKTALEAAIEADRGDELESRTDEELSAMASSATDQDVSMDEPRLEEPVREYRNVLVRALTGEIDHDTYTEREPSARADLANATGDVAQSAFLEGAGEQVDLNEQMEIPEQGAMEQQVTVVSWLDRLAIVIPIVGLALIGGVWYLTRSVGRTIGTLGWSLVWAGIPAFLTITVLFSDLGAVLDVGSDPDPVTTTMLVIAERTVGHLTAQSLAIGVLGVGLVGLAFGLKSGVHERFLGEREPTASGEAVETEGTGDPLADRNEDQADSTDSDASQQDDR